MILSRQTEKFLQEKIARQLNSHVSSIEFHSVGGGSINHTFKLSVNRQQHYFLKVNSYSKFPALFEAEKSGLEFLGNSTCIHTPKVMAYDKHNDEQFLLLEWINAGHRDEGFWKLFGKNLAKLHLYSDENFGFHEDNYMGSLPQQNTFTQNWTEFFINYRLSPQINLAVKNHLLSTEHVAQFENLYKKIPSIFAEEKPSLLHGDLWSGNFMCNEQSEPVLIDPAVYFGHRSMDLAMTTLFGGFDKLFYESYHYYYPFPANYREQWQICNLYPLLIHLNLFGKSYLYDILQTLKNYH
jgi:protein-ribulosamine 3-kinase